VLDVDEVAAVVGVAEEDVEAESGGGVDTALDNLDDVALTAPEGTGTLAGDFVIACDPADAKTKAGEAVAISIDMGKRFAKDFAGRVEVDGARGPIVGDRRDGDGIGGRRRVTGGTRRIFGPIAKDDLIGAAIDDATHSGEARGFEDVLGTDDVVVENTLPGRGTIGVGGEVNHDIHAGDGLLDGGKVAEVGEAKTVGRDFEKGGGDGATGGTLGVFDEAVRGVEFRLGGKVGVGDVADEAVGTGDKNF